MPADDDNTPENFERVNERLFPASFFSTAPDANPVANVTGAHDDRRNEVAAAGAADANVAALAAPGGVALAIADDRKRMAAIARLAEQHRADAEWTVGHFNSGASITEAGLLLAERSAQEIVFKAEAERLTSLAHAKADHARSAGLAE
jgi:hypothetical protein